MVTGVRARFLRPRRVTTLFVVLILLMMMPLAVYAAAPENTKGFRKAVKLEGVREHQAALQSFADANDGTRASGLPGYDDSAQYVYDRMTAAGYDVSFQDFSFDFFDEISPPELGQTAPGSVAYVAGVDMLTLEFSSPGDVTASVTAVDLQLGLGNTSTSGCEAADFAGFPAGNIVLVQRGSCSFQQKAENAAAAGAVGVIIFNQGNVATPDRFDVFGGTLSAAYAGGIPVVSTSYDRGVEWAGTAGLIMFLTVDTVSELRTTRNVIAETPGGDPDHVVVVGAHLDSVPEGPGINDNGSGSAAILEVAEVYAAQDREPRNKLRFIWFGAEEAGLVGSGLYVDSLSQDDLDRIELMLNFDMIGSPNFVRFIYDGDNSAFPPGPNVGAGPPGSDEIEAEFSAYFGSEGLATEETPFSGRSDYGPFIAVGIPAGGLFTGAEGIKTPAEQAIYGGTTGIQYDPCYHQACDTYANNSNMVLDQMSDAVAHIVLLFSKRNFDHDPLN